jgi:hypothetical protein
MTVYQHVLPGMQRDAADLFARLVSTDEIMVAVADRWRGPDAVKP